MEGRDRNPAPPSDHESASLMSQAPAPKGADQGGGWKVESVNIRQADNGGFTVSCSKKREGKSNGNGLGSGSDYKSSDNVFSDVDSMLAYVKSEFGGAEEPDDAQEEPAQGGGYGAAAAAQPPAGAEGGADAEEEQAF